MAPTVPTSMQQPVSRSPRIYQASGHHMYYTNKGSMKTKTETDAKLAKIKYLLSRQNQDKDLIVQFHLQ